MGIAVVYVNGEESAERAAKHFKRLVEREGIIKDWRKKERYEKPCSVRKREKKVAIRKHLKRIKKQQQTLS